MFAKAVLVNNIFVFNLVIDKFYKIEFNEVMLVHEQQMMFQLLSGTD